MNNMDNIGIGKKIAHYGVLALICLLSFLVAKYIVRSAIDGETSPVDTSERL